MGRVVFKAIIENYRLRERGLASSAVLRGMVPLVGNYAKRQ
jgi:hypothetical protein